MSKKDEFDFSDAVQGAIVQPAPGKTRITIRVDSDVLQWFRDKVHKAGGGNYQTLINDALRDHIEFHDGQLEMTLRQVIREELQALSR